ncbi:MAG: DedA family protein [Bacteroidaceae bacterium]|nr:DedA family protein [Bacteroidaceae bacterium]
MESLVEFLLSYGYGGMFAAAFLAGSFFPFSSEAVMTALTLAGLNVWLLIAYSTVGNTLGGVFNYGVGRMGREDWVYGLLHLSNDRMVRGKALVRRYGIWMGLLSWVPFLGSAITVAMGLLRLPFWPSAATIFMGKCLRYFLLALILNSM